MSGVASTLTTRMAAATNSPPLPATTTPKPSPQSQATSGTTWGRNERALHTSKTALHRPRCTGRQSTAKSLRTRRWQIGTKRSGAGKEKTDAKECALHCKGVLSTIPEAHGPDAPAKTKENEPSAQRETESVTVRPGKMTFWNFNRRYVAVTGKSRKACRAK